MATYLELKVLTQDIALRDKVEIAVDVKAAAILDDGAATTAEVDWASEAIMNPSLRAVEILNYVLAVNKGLSVEAIQGASDAAIQSNVDTAVDAIISGGV